MTGEKMFIEESVLNSHERLCQFLNETESSALENYLDIIKLILVLPVSGNYSYDKPKPMKVNVVDLCALYGKQKHIAFIAKHLKLFELMQKAKFRAFRFAVANAHIETFKLLCSYLPEGCTKHMRTHGYMIFRYAAKSGDIPMMKYLIDIAGEYAHAMIGAQNNKALEMAQDMKNEGAVDLILTNPGSLKYALDHKEKYIEALNRYLKKMK